MIGGPPCQDSQMQIGKNHLISMNNGLVKEILQSSQGNTPKSFCDGKCQYAQIGNT